MSLKDDERITQLEQSINALAREFEAGNKGYDEALQKQASMYSNLPIDNVRQ